jgi:putative MFS transporter
MMPVGAFVSAVVTLLLAQRLGWRGMFLLGIVPAFIAYVVRRRIPESPRWLAAKGRTQEAEEALIRIGATRDAIREARKALPYDESAGAKSEDKTLKEKYRELFSLRWLRRNIVSWTLWIAPNSVILAVNLWLPSYLMAVYHFTLVKSLSYSVANTAAGVVGRLIAVYLIDKVGRKPLIIGTFSLAAICLVAVSLVSSPVSLIYCLGGFTFFVDGGIVVAVTYVPELYPTRIRSIGSSSASAASRITAAAAPIMIGALIGLNLHRLIWLIFAAGLAVSVVVTAIFGPETKGKTLEEVQRGPLAQATGVSD